jgi:hypothetical protein
MQHWRFRAGAHRWRLVTRALVASTLVAVVAVLAVGADAGTPRPQLASVQRAPYAPIGADVLGAPASASNQTGYVVLKPRDPQELQSFIASVNKPHSPLYHQYLRAGQFDSRFGPSSATVDAVRSQLGADGLRVMSVARDGLLIGFSGTTANVETAFGTKLERYRSAAGITGEQTTKAISLPTTISSDVTAVIGLNTLVHPEAAVVRPPSSAYAGHAAAKTAAFTHYTGAPSACSTASSDATEFGGLTDDQIANAYGTTPLYGSGDTGAGVNIGVYELEPYSSTDLQTFDDCYFGNTQGNAMASSVTTTNVGSGQPSGPGTGESILDIEDVSAMAPGAQINVYEAPNTNADSLEEYEQMVDADQDQIITSSWGICEQDLQMADPGAQQAEAYIFEQAAAQGQTVLNDTGDTGDDTCNEVRDVPPPSDQNPLSVGDPASQPYVLAVGGTTIDDADPAHYDETVWNDGAEWGSGGGGLSESWAAPTWQQSLPYFSGGSYATDLSNANSVEGGNGVSSENLTPGFCTDSTTANLPSGTPCRGLPDVSGQSDQFTGAVTTYMDSEGGWLTSGGTSSATPIWAAMLALVDSSSTCPAAVSPSTKRPGIGFASPLLYAVAADPTEYAASFHDVTVGNNDAFGLDSGLDFPARTGYDLATGLGSPILAGANDTPGLASYLCALASSGSPRPTIASLSSTSGPVAGGGSITVTGTGLTDASEVTVGGAAAPSFAVIDDDHLQVTLPAGTASLAPGGQSVTDPVTRVRYTTAGSTGTQDGAGPANVEVTLTSGLSTTPSPASLYSYVDRSGSSDVPSVSSISPYAGRQNGGTITVYGSGFETNGSPSVSAVTVGNLDATNVTVDSNWELTATAPAFNATGTQCLTAASLVTELDAGNGGSGGLHPSRDDICQTDVVVTNNNGSSATDDPLPSYLGELPQANQDGMVEIPNQNCEGLTGGCEVTPQPTEYDYVPAPTVTSVTALSTVHGDVNADPGSYGDPTLLEIHGTGLTYQTLNWLSFGDPADAADQDAYYPLSAIGTSMVVDAPESPTVAAGNDLTTAAEDAPVVVNTMAGQSTDDSSCTQVATDCVTYSGVPKIVSVDSDNTTDGIGTSPDTGGAAITINGQGLNQVVGPIEFLDTVAPPAGVPPFSIGTQYSYTSAQNGSSITAETVSQNPAFVDTYVCSDSGCFPGAGDAEDELLLYPPGAPVISSVQDASGPALGGTLVTINGENLGCVTSVSFGSTVADSFSKTQALLDCGSTTQLTVVAPPGSTGESVPITVTTIESDVTDGNPATSPTDFTYDTANPSVTTAVAFGSVDLGSSTGGTVTITNPAAATRPLVPEPEIPNPNSGTPATIPAAASIAGGNGNFTITSDPCSGAMLNPGQSCAIQVRFAPTGLGSGGATLDIPWNNSTSVDAASDTPDFTVSLSGTGAEPTSTITTPGATTSTTITKTVTKTVTCTITVTHRWVTVKVHGKKKREYKKVTTRSKGCPKPATKKAAKPKRKHERPSKKHRRRRTGGAL